MKPIGQWVFIALLGSVRRLLPSQVYAVPFARPKLPRSNHEIDQGGRLLLVFAGIALNA